MASKRQKSKLDAGGTEAGRSRLDVLRGTASGSRAADWGDAMPELLASLVVSTSRLGGLCSLGQTSDRGALSVTIFLDGDKHTEYIKPSENLDERLEAIIVMLDTLG